MPRNGSGTFSLPVAPFTPGTTISSSDVNSDFSDIATALTGSIAADGQTAITGQLKGALGTAPTYSISGDLNTGFGSSTADTAFIQCGGANVISCTTTTATILALTVTNASTFNSTSTFNNTITLATAAINETSTTLASASTVNIGAAAANYIFISGTVTITAFDAVASGIERTLEFQGALTLTYNATTLILPGSVSITTAAGDTAIFRSEGSGNWRCISYVRRAVAPLTGTLPTVQRFTSGTSQTYTAPTGVLRQRVRMIGPGGGGGASATNNGSVASGDASFQVNGSGTAWTAIKGGGGSATGAGAAGGTGGADGSTGTLVVRVPGGGGGSGLPSIGAVGAIGGAGGNSALGAGARGVSGATAGVAGPGAGSGGGGGSDTSGRGGGGGGAGEYVEFWVTGMTTATYTLPAGGAGGVAGTQAGGNGSTPILIIEEFYP